MCRLNARDNSAFIIVLAEDEALTVPPPVKTFCRYSRQTYLIFASGTNNFDVNFLQDRRDFLLQYRILK